MPDIAAIIQSGIGNPWLLVPMALVLGALHALEPGHSKSMMTAFIVAVHGTAAQATLLAVAATIGHTIIVWILAILAWRLGDTALLERAEPWLLLAGGILLVVLAIRILWRLGAFGSAGVHGHDHSHDHGHHHAGHARGGHHHDHHSHDHDHGHAHQPHPHFESEDEHAAYHAAQVQKQFAGRSSVTNAEVAWFGFTGGLLPCPAAFAVLLACLKTKAYGLGIVMVAAFSLGLALMLVAIGVAAAWGANALRERSEVFDRWAGRAPIISAAIVLVIGLVTMWAGVRGLS